MKRERPFELDPEFQVLPYEERRDATDLKFWHGVRRETAARSRRIRNGLGATSVLALAGIGVAHYAEGVNFDTVSGIAVGVGVGFLTGAVSSRHNQANREDAMANRNAEIVAEMFKRAELEPPTWTQEAQQS